MTTLAQKYPKSSRVVRNLYRAVRGTYDDPRLWPNSVRRNIEIALKFGNEIQGMRAAYAALGYASKLVRVAMVDAGADRADESKHKVEHATRITKAARGLLKSLSK